MQKLQSIETLGAYQMNKPHRDMKKEISIWTCDALQFTRIGGDIAALAAAA